MFQVRVDHYEQVIDQEAALLDDPMQSYLDDMSKHVIDEVRSLGSQMMGISQDIENNRDAIHSLSESIIALREQVTVLASKLPKSVPPSTPRAIIAPRSYSFNRHNNTPSTPRDHNSSSRDRSRSPLINRHSSHKSVPPHKAPIRCTFCDSGVHYSRNCSEVKSLTRRLQIMPRDSCAKCFRPLNDSHSSMCEPDICRRGCIDGANRPQRHMEWFCPRNPSLDE